MIFFRDRLFFFSSAISFLLHIILWVVVVRIWFFLKESGETFIALHARVFYGIDFIGEPYLVFLLPLLGLSTIGVNYALARKSFGVSRFLLGALSSISVIMQLFLIVIAVLVFQLNLY